jgi:hypothetical protein
VYSWLLLSVRHCRRRGLSFRLLLRMARHRDCMPRGPLQRCCSSDVELHLFVVPRRFLLCGPFAATRLPFGPLECDGGTDGRAGLHGLCSGTVRSVQRTSECSSGLYQLPIGHMGQCACTGCRQLVYQLCGRYRRCVCGSKHRRCRMHGVCRRFLLPGRDQSSDLYRRRLLPVRHKHSEPELSRWFLLHLAEHQSGLSYRSIQSQQWTHRASVMCGVFGGQVRRTGGTNQRGSRLRQLCTGHMGSHGRCSGFKRVHQLCRRHSWTSRGSINRSRRMPPL